MPRKQITDMIAELRSWLPNYDHGPDSYPNTLFRLLASLPGGDELADMGYEPWPGISFHEADQLGRMLQAIENQRDVEDLVKGLLAEEEDLEEAKRVRRHDGPSYAPGMPTVKAIPHHHGNGYAYEYVYNGEEYSSQRKAPFKTANAAVKAGEVAKQIEWDTAEPIVDERVSGRNSAAREASNIFWRDIPAGAKVELVDHAYYVTMPDGSRKGAYWGGQDASQAQRALNGWAKRGVREVREHPYPPTRTPQRRPTPVRRRSR